MDCYMGKCLKCWGTIYLILGALILINDWWLQWTWWTFIGVIFVLFGVFKIMKPYCPHCEHHEQKMMEKKKR